MAGTATGARRDEDMAEFLRGSGWDPLVARPLAGDASNRRYLRLNDGARRAVLMDASPERGEDVRPFAAVTRLLRRQGLSAPAILAASEAQGFLLLEDLGDALFARICAERPSEEATLYAAAVDLLSGALGPPPAAGSATALPSYDMAVLLREARLAPDWYLAGAAGGPATADLLAEYEGLVGATLDRVATERSAIVLRDYHAENLIWLPGRAGAARVGLLDYQDALAGHPAYDLVSLLEDARRDTPPELRTAMLARFLDRSPELDRGAFAAAYAALGAQRNLKILGIFARLCLRDAKPRYLGLIPRVWDHLMHDLEHPALAPLRAWTLRHLPPPAPALLERIAAQAGSGSPA